MSAEVCWSQDCGGSQKAPHTMLSQKIAGKLEWEYDCVICYWTLLLSPCLPYKGTFLLFSFLRFIFTISALHCSHFNSCVSLPQSIVLPLSARPFCSRLISRGRLDNSCSFFTLRSRVGTSCPTGCSVLQCASCWQTISIFFFTLTRPRICYVITFLELSVRLWIPGYNLMLPARDNMFMPSSFHLTQTTWGPHFLFCFPKSVVTYKASTHAASEVGRNDWNPIQPVCCLSSQCLWINVR